MSSNPRYTNGNLRRKHRARLAAMGLPCAICGAPINYDEPSNAEHPLSFVVDEIRPVSKYWMFGYGSREECAQDWNNLQPAHYACNQAKKNKTNFHIDAAQVLARHTRAQIIADGEW